MLIVNIIGVTLLAVFMIFILGKKPKLRPDYLLMLILMLYMAYLGSNIWIKADVGLWSFLYQTVTAASLFFPFVVYALLLIQKDHQFNRSWWWFASFDLVYLIFVATDLFVLDRLEYSSVYDLYTDPPPSYMVFYKSHGIYKIAVLVWLLRKLNSYQNQIEDYYSNLDSVSLKWLKAFVWVYIGENAVSTIIFIPYNLGYIKDIETPFLVTNSVFVLSLFYLIYHGIKQYTLANFSDERSGQFETRGKQHSKEKYQTSSFSEEEMKKLFGKIKSLFSEEKIYHDPELKIQHLAKHLGVTSHNISQTINQLAKKTFFEFVNSYRVAYFKWLLSDPEKKKFTILALGMESGFNSKASLNRIFKKQIGITPREYQQQVSSS